MKKLLLLLLVLVAILVAGTVWFYRNRDGSPTTEGIVTLPVEFGTLIESVGATGVVQPGETYLVGSEAMGRVVEIAADFNQEVEEGQILLRLDDRVPRQQREQASTAVEAALIGVRQAEAQRDTARSLLDREQARPPELRRDIEVVVLKNQLAVAEASIDAAQNKVKQARQALTLADLALEKTVVRAPVVGRTDDDRPGMGSLTDVPRPTGTKRKYLVMDRRASLGQSIGPALQGHLFTLAGNLDIVRIESQVAEGDIARVAVGMEAEFTTPSSADDDAPFKGKVTSVRELPINDRGAVFYKVVIEAKNERDPNGGRRRLTPGLTATVDIVRRRRDRTWKVPTSAFAFQPESARLTASAREKLERLHDLKNSEQWKTVWVVADDRTIQPVFVRIGGVGNDGAPGIRDPSFNEVLEWDSELSPRPQGGKPETYPRVIVSAPAGTSGLFNPPNVKF